MKPNKKLKSKKIVDDVLRVHNIKANIKKLGGNQIQT